MKHSEIILKLIGPLRPIGETNEDLIRFENLKTLCECAEEILLEINRVACRTHGNEFSIKRNVDFAKEFLDRIDERYLSK